jgi:hypothetical protein
MIDRCLERILTISKCELVTFSVLVVDDGSDDDTLQHCQMWRSSFASCNVKFNILSRGFHLGLPQTLDEGLLHISSEFVARDDDIWPGRLTAQVSFLRANAQIHVVGTQARLERTHSKCDDVEVFDSQMPTHWGLVSLQSFFSCPILHPTVCFRRTIAVECGGYMARDQSSFDSTDEGREAHANCVTFIEDFYLWCRILLR